MRPNYGLGHARLKVPAVCDVHHRRYCQQRIIRGVFQTRNRVADGGWQVVTASCQQSLIDFRVWKTLQMIRLRY